MPRRKKTALNHQEAVAHVQTIDTDGEKPDARVLAISNNKGGTGKTTTAMNLAGALVLKERRVLVIEDDPETAEQLVESLSTSGYQVDLAVNGEPSGKLLVLAPPPNYDRLRTESRFVLLSTPSLAKTRTVVLRAAFKF